MDQAIIPHQDEDYLYNDLCHRVFTHLNGGKLHQAPLASPRSVLDIGCGSGIWTIEFAKKHPSCQVLGVDLQPGGNPSNVHNCTFAAADIQENWGWLPAEPIDFIHVRGLGGFVNSWPNLLTRAFDCLAPGGWLEVSDIGYETASHDGSLNKAHGLRRFDQLFQQTLIKMGQDPGILPVLGHEMERIGFRPIVTGIHEAAFSDWSESPATKQGIAAVSKLHELDTVHIVERGIKPVLGLSANEAADVLVEALRDMRNKKIHAYRPCYIFSGQKPERDT